MPLPIVFSRRLGLGKAPTRGAPTRLSSLGVLTWEGHPQGVPLPIVFSRRLALERAPTRGAPTDCFVSAFGPGKGTHKGCPYRLSSLGVWAWEGHPQGVPLPIVFSRRFDLRRAGCPYRLSSLGVLTCEGHPQGAPLPIVCLLSAFGKGPGKGTHKGRPYPIVFSRRLVLGRAPTRGAPTRLFCLGVWAWERRLGLGRAPTRDAPTDCLLSAFGPGKGTHKGCPYRLSCLGVWSWKGHPQGVPLPIVLSRRLVLERAHTRGAPTDCLVSAFGPGKGTHKGCPYRLSSRRLALGRVPTRGAPTRFRQPHEVFSNLMQLP